MCEGAITFHEFLAEYNEFYSYYALDGHESDELELSMFERYALRIQPHEDLTLQVFTYRCDDDDATKEIYIQAGRFGSTEALRRLKLISNKYFRSKL